VFGQLFTARAELLYPVVAGIGDEDVARRADGDASRFLELGFAGSFAGDPQPLELPELPFAALLLDAPEFAGFRIRSPDCRCLGERMADAGDEGEGTGEAEMRVVVAVVFGGRAFFFGELEEHVPCGVGDEEDPTIALTA